MRVVIADDDRVLRHALTRQLAKWGLPSAVYADGRQLRDAITSDGVPDIALIDWDMPEIDGLTMTQEIRRAPRGEHAYIIIITSNREKRDVIRGLNSGADDYVLKPFDWDELRARIRIGQRTAGLQRLLAERVRELETAARRVQELSGLLPICSYCKSIRSDDDYWEQLETYLAQHSNARFTHGICPTCFEAVRESYGCGPIK